MRQVDSRTLKISRSAAYAALRGPGSGVEALIIGEAGVEPGSEGISPGAGDPGLPHCLQASLGGQQDLAVGGRGRDPLVAEWRRGEQPPGRAVAGGGAAEAGSAANLDSRGTVRSL